MYRLVYRNPIEDDGLIHVVMKSVDLDEIEKTKWNIFWSLMSNTTVYDDEPVIWVEDLSNNKRLD